MTCSRAAIRLLRHIVRVLAADTDLSHGTVWITEATPVECARSRPTVRRSDLAGWGWSYTVAAASRA